jgi:VCBS repeat-containing protein
LNIVLSYLNSAPQSFQNAMQAAANILDSLILNNITVNIQVAYDTSLGTSAEGGDLSGNYVSYSTLRAALASHETTAADQTFVNSLPNTSTISGVNGSGTPVTMSTFWVPSAIEKALGLPTTSTTDGGVWMGSQIPSSLLVGVALHELTHAMGREPGVGPFDLFRYTTSGQHLFSASATAPAAHFSINGGSTDLADFGRNSDPSDFLNSGVQGSTDPFDEFYSGSTQQNLTAVDKELMDVLGFNISNSIVVAPTASKAPQGGAAVALLSGPPTITDSISTTLSGATIKIANSSGNAVTGDELYINGQQSGTVDGGLVTVNWNNSTKVLTLTGNASMAAYQTLLGQVSYQDAGTDSSTGSHPQRTITWTVNDGTSNLSTTSQITIDRLPVANNDAASAVVGTSLIALAPAGVLNNDADSDNDTLIVSGVSDSAHGAGMVGQTVLAGVYGHLVLNPNGSYAYFADIASAINSAPPGSHLQDTFNYTASDGNGGTAAAALTITLDRLPMVMASNVTASREQTSVPASSLFTASDPDGDTVGMYHFYDATGNGHFVVNGVAQPTATSITVTAAQLAQISYQFGSGSDQLFVQAYDGMQWSNWQPFMASPGVDSSPVVTASDVTASHNQNFAASSLFTASDPDGDIITTYHFYDATGNGHFVVNGVAQPTATSITVTAAQLGQTSYQSGSGADQLFVQAYDGTLWSNWKPFLVNAPPDNPPVVMASDLTATHSESFAASSLFTASDPDGDAITTYHFYDATGNGHFVVNGVAQPAATSIAVSAAQLAQTSYQSGSGADQLFVQAYDGTLWSNWKPFMVNAPVDRAPVVMAPDVTATHNQSFAASSLFTASDPDGDTISMYHFYDATGNGHFVVNGVAQPTATSITVTAAQLAQTSYQSGSGADQLFVQAYDGTLWSNWLPFMVNAPVDRAPVVTAPDVNASHNQSFAASSLFTASDPDGDAISMYHFYNATGNGHFVVNGIAQPTATSITVTAAELAQTSYQSGAGSDQLFVQAYDGTLWSNWQPFMVNADFHIV